MPAKLDLTGHTYGRWTVIGPHHTKPGYWAVRCICGNAGRVSRIELRCGGSKSCGCLRRDHAATLSAHHPAISTNTVDRRRSDPSLNKVYRAWCSIKRRCLNPNSVEYHHYGGRGIKVCHNWCHSFYSFLYDMGRPPSPQHTIDRIDNDKGYSPTNCRWATPAQQGTNRRNTRFLTIGEATKPLSVWAHDAGLPTSVVNNRRLRGWEPDTLLLPIRPRRTNLQMHQSPNS